MLFYPAEFISIYVNLYLSILIYCFLFESIPINLIYLSESVSMNLNLFLSVFIYDYPSDYISIYLLNFYLSDSISIFLIYVYLSESIYRYLILYLAIRKIFLRKISTIVKFWTFPLYFFWHERVVEELLLLKKLQKMSR